MQFLYHSAVSTDSCGIWYQEPEFLGFITEHSVFVSYWRGRPTTLVSFSAAKDLPRRDGAERLPLRG
jgi:hypothetical protein